MAEAPISTLFPSAGAARAAEPSARPAPATKPVENKQPSKFEKELKATSSERPISNAKPSRESAPAKGATEQADRQVLQPLRKVAAKNKQAVDGAPVVALLTGKLDRLPASSIPDLVSTNEFVTSALGEGELEGFMSKPMPIGDMLESLGMPPAVLAEAEQLGLDLAAIVSPNEILRALGVDPQRVFAELKQLKDNLSLDGLQGYMQRAAIMQRGAGADSSMRADALQQERLNREADAARAAAESLPRRTAPEITLGKSLANSTPVKSPQADASTTPQSLSSSIALEQLAPWQVASGLTSGLNNTDANIGKFQQFPGVDQQNRGLQVENLKSASISDDFANIARLQAARTLDSQSLANANAMQGIADQAAEPNVSDLAQQGLSDSPSMNRASYDAFAAIGTQLRDENTIRIKNASELGQAPIATSDPFTSSQQASPDTPTTLDDLLRNLANSTSNRAETVNNQSAMAIKPTAVTLVQDAALVAQTTGISDQTIKSERLNVDALDERSTRTGEGNWLSMFASKPVEVVAATPQRVNLDELARAFTLDQPKSEKDRESESDDSQAFDSSAGFDPTRGFETLTGTNQNPTKTTRTNEFANHLSAPTTQMNPQDRAEIMRQVIDRATFLAKDGGGIIRLDLSNADVGPLELAVNMQNDRLDLRILTANDRARDIMAGEMSSLRDALSVQNLQLGSVEVGVGQRDSERSKDLFSAFQQNNSARQFGDGNERRERARNWESDVNDRARGLRTISSTPRVANLPSYVRMPTTSSGDGRIAIRA